MKQIPKERTEERNNETTNEINK